VLSKQNHFLFENQVCLKAYFCLPSSGRRQLATQAWFFSTCKALLLFDLGVYPENLGIMVDKKLLNNSCGVEEMVQIPIKSDQISLCISNYEIK